MNPMCLTVDTMNKLKKSLRMAAVFLLPALVAITACTPPPQGGSGASQPTTTEWKEGYGGGSIQIEIVRMIEQTCFATRRLRPKLLQGALQTDKDVATSICNLLNVGELVIAPVDQPVIVDESGKSQSRDMANFPKQRPRRLEVKISYWTNANISHEAREKLLYHELLLLNEIDDKDFVRSTRLALAIQASLGKATDLVCDSYRTQSLLAGADPQMARTLGRELARLRCRPGFEVIRDRSQDDSFDDVMRSELQHGFIYGIFVNLARTNDEHLIFENEALFIDALHGLSDATTAWSQDFCAEVSEALPPPLQRKCGGIFNLMTGATPSEKLEVVGLGARAVDFDRAAVSLLNRIGMLLDPHLIGLLKDGDTVDRGLVRGAIRSQNWAQLMILGHIQHLLNPNVDVAEILLKNLDWRRVLEEGILVKNTSPVQEAGRSDYRVCREATVRRHAEDILRGNWTTLRCFNSQII